VGLRRKLAFFRISLIFTKMVKYFASHKSHKATLISVSLSLHQIPIHTALHVFGKISMTVGEAFVSFFCVLTASPSSYCFYVKFK